MAEQETQQEDGGGVAVAQDTVTITYNRSGQSYELKGVNDGTIKAMDLRQIKGVGGPLRPDGQLPGVHEHGVVSQLGDLHRKEGGAVEHRGYPIEQLCEKSTYLEVAYLLIYGELPTQETSLPRGFPRSPTTPSSTRTSRSSSRASATTPIRWTLSLVSP